MTEDARAAALPDKPKTEVWPWFRKCGTFDCFRWADRSGFCDRHQQEKTGGSHGRRRKGR